MRLSYMALTSDWRTVDLPTDVNTASKQTTLPTRAVKERCNSSWRRRTLRGLQPSAAVLLSAERHFSVIRQSGVGLSRAIIGTCSIVCSLFVASSRELLLARWMISFLYVNAPPGSGICLPIACERALRFRRSSALPVCLSVSVGGWRTTTGICSGATAIAVQPIASPRN